MWFDRYGGEQLVLQQFLAHGSRTGNLCHGSQGAGADNAFWHVGAAAGSGGPRSSQRAPAALHFRALRTNSPLFQQRSAGLSV